MPERDLKKRTFDFSVAVGKLIIILPFTVANKEYSRQLIRCSSSIGANYRAVQRAKSDNDFINKLKIVEEEADESIYFLELILVFNPDQTDTIKPLIQEGTEILKMIVAAINKMRERINNKGK